MLMNLRYILVLGCLLAITSQSFAQIDEVYDDEITDSVNLEKKGKIQKEKKIGAGKKLQMKGLYIGSGLGFDVWRNYLRFDMSPHVGYRIGDVIAPAIGVTYIYFNELGAGISTNVIGPKFMLRIRPIKNIPTLNRIYLVGEAEYLTYKQKNGGRVYTDHQTRVNAGLGYTTNFENGFGFTTEVLFDFYYLKTGWTHLNPFTYRIGFYYGF